MLECCSMKLLCIMALVCTIPLVGLAQDDDSIEKWVRENVDEDILNVLQNLKLPEVREFFDDMLKQFQGDDVVDMDQLRQVATTVLPLLDAHVETQPYAAWLRTRLDYFEVAGKLRATTQPLPTPTPAPAPNRPATPLPNPSPEKEREVWQKELEKRPPLSGTEAFAARLKPIFLAQQVPPALVWMAEVESSFTPNARSPSGAVGLFQLMPDTARSQHLSLWPRDQRLDPEKNAACAARRLKVLHNRFKDWPLVLAAYNSGEGRVQTLLEKHKVKTYDAISTHLPAETQLYVPKINATLLSREGVSLADLSVHDDGRAGAR